MARNSLRVMPGFMRRMVACGGAADQARAPRGAHSSLVLHIYDLRVQRLLQLERCTGRGSEARMADEPSKLRIGARERAQQALIRITLVLRGAPSSTAR